MDGIKIGGWHCNCFLRVVKNVGIRLMLGCMAIVPVAFCAHSHFTRVQQAINYVSMMFSLAVILLYDMLECRLSHLYSSETCTVHWPLSLLSPVQ